VRFWNGTTRYGRSWKKLPRFCDFLLTGSSHGSILQLQIRGTWKRQTDQSRGVAWSGKGHEPAQNHRKKRARSGFSAQYVWRRTRLFSRVKDKTGMGQRIRFLRLFFGWSFHGIGI
jgi:hypothetical protein